MSLELFLAYKIKGDIQTRNALIQSNMGLARKAAHAIARKCSEPYEDLVQVGALGLTKAVERFDPEKGNKFSSFAMPYVAGAIKQYLRDKGHTIRLTQRVQTLFSQSKKAVETLSLTLGRKPLNAEVAQYLQVSEKEYENALAAVRDSRSPLDLKAELVANSLTSYDFDLPEWEKEADRLWELRMQTEQSLVSVLGKIYLSDLWQNRYDNFLDYFKVRFAHWGRSHIYRMKDATISFTDLLSLLSPCGEELTELPVSEFQMRPLTGLTPEQKLTVWRRAKEIGGRKPTHSQVSQARNELIPSISYTIGEPVLANQYAAVVVDLSGKVYVPAMGEEIRCSSISSIPPQHHASVKQVCDRIAALKSIPLSRGVAGFLDELSRGMEYSAQDLAVLEVIEKQLLSVSAV